MASFHYRGDHHNISGIEYVDSVVFRLRNVPQYDWQNSAIYRGRDTVDKARFSRVVEDVTMKFVLIQIEREALLSRWVQPGRKGVLPTSVAGEGRRTRLGQSAEQAPLKSTLETRPGSGEHSGILKAVLWYRGSTTVPLLSAGIRGDYKIEIMFISIKWDKNIQRMSFSQHPVCLW